MVLIAMSGGKMAELELKLDEETRLFVEVEGDTDDRRERVSTRSEKLTAEFSKVTGGLSEMAKAMREKLFTGDASPDKVEMEMGVALKGEADLWLVKGEGSGHIKLKLTWDRDKASNATS